MVGITLMALAILAVFQSTTHAEGPNAESLMWQLPNEKLRQPFEQRHPIYFVAKGTNPREWLNLKSFWNVAMEEAVNPKTGEKVTRKAVKIKVPLGLNSAPKVPLENEITVDRWVLGKKLYFDPILSANNTVSCASCHNPELGWTDQSPVSTGIGGAKGGVSSPPVFNSAYSPRQFWDGRAMSLEDQSQGPPGNPIEMAGKDPHPWKSVVLRIRKQPDYVEMFKKAYGTEPTRDGVAKAIATFERTVLLGDSVYDRGPEELRARAIKTRNFKAKLSPVDYESVLRKAIGNKEAGILEAFGIQNKKDAERIPQIAESIFNGQTLFFNKARCSKCHVGDNFTDNQFHNLGVGVVDGKIPANQMGRYAAEPTGHKNPEHVGAFKTPGLRGLLSTAPYMHDGSEKTLTEVVEFYNKGGNANRYLAPEMRDIAAEQKFLENPKAWKGTDPRFGPDNVPIVPLKLNLTKQEVADLVSFLKALQGSPVNPYVADPNVYPPLATAKK